MRAKLLDGQQRLTCLTILLSVVRHLANAGDSTHPGDAGLRKSFQQAQVSCGVHARCRGRAGGSRVL